MSAAWEITGLYRQTSGLPFTVINGQRWPTNWNLGGNATPNGQPIPAVVSTGNATGIAGPNLWQDPAAAFAAFREDFAGESGGRTNLRGEGLFNIDSGVYKSFTMPWSEHQKLTFRWESYNLTNSVRFDPAVGSGLRKFGQQHAVLVELRQADHHAGQLAPDAVRAALHLVAVAIAQ